MAAAKGNKYALGNKGGRPPHYKTPEELETKIIEYFDYIQGEVNAEIETIVTPEGIEKTNYDRQPEPPTSTGLALFLGFDSMQTLYNYRDKEDFSYAIRRALMIVENSYELSLRNGSPTGSIFALKNMGWKDKTEVEQTNTNKVQVFKIGDQEFTF